MEHITKITTIAFLALLYTHFFGAISIQNSYLFLLLIPFTIDSITKKNLFGRYIFLMILGIFFSILSSYWFRDQSIPDSLHVVVPYLFICFYFVILRFNLTLADCEKLIFILSLLFCLCYLLQYAIYPKEIFEGASRIGIEDDVRIRMYGQGLSSLGYFFGLNKFIEKRNPVYLLLSLLCFSVIFLMGFRTMFAMIIVFSIVLIIRLKGFNKIMFVYAGIILLALYFIGQTSLFSSVFDRMLERSQTETFSNEDYIRVKQIQYFTNDHFHNFVEYFFGSGMPNYEKSKYGEYMFDLAMSGINHVDFGLLSLSFMLGVITVSAMVLYSVKAIKAKVDKNYYYAGCWFMYLLAISVTTIEFARFGNFIVQSFALYLIEKANQLNKLPISKQAIN